MACHQADVAQQAAWRSSGRRSSCPQWHLLRVAFGAPWRDLPEAFGPYTTCYNRFVRWRRAGVQMHLLPPMMPAVPMIGTSIVRVHRHAQEPRARQFEFCKPHQHGYPVQALCPKINRFRFSEIHVFLVSFRAGVRGVSRSSRNVERNAVDADVPVDERHRGGRRSCVVLSPRRWRQVRAKLKASRGRRWQTSIGSPRRAPISRKPSRREGRCDHRLYLWFSRSRKFLLRGSPGACGHPAFPAPSPSFRGQTTSKARAQFVGRERGGVSWTRVLRQDT